MNTPAGADRVWLQRAIDLSRRSSQASTGYRVGAVVVSGSGLQLAEGYSRECDPHVHAEESALAKLVGHVSGEVLAGATIYSSLEPCSVRRSRPHPCAELILAAGLRRVVFALREPLLFAECHGVEMLEVGGAEVIEITDLADEVRVVNAHILGPL
jgi:diaminohydroxyphosphoribosylaminopyrimidine deaminase/5-amino-6-(5-phosphoribosylamino)uracil reductase